METIFKYIIPVGGGLVNMPHDAQILSITEQHDEIAIYAIINPEDKKFSREFDVYGTGHPLRDNLLDHYRFLGTVNTHKGQLMWHVFIDRSDE